MKKLLVVTFTLTFIVVLCSVAVVSLFALNYVGTVEVAGVSMEPSYKTGDRCLIRKRAYESSWPERFDVVVYQSPDNGIMYLHRIIGLPGEEVTIKDGRVYIDGALLDEPYLADGTDTEWKEKKPFGDKVTIEEDNYYVLGDNRDLAKDSRVFGTIKKDMIKGKVGDYCW